MIKRSLEKSIIRGTSYKSKACTAFALSEGDESSVFGPSFLTSRDNELEGVCERLELGFFVGVGAGVGVG